MQFFRPYFNDFHLPYNEVNLPSFLPDNREGHNLRQAFLEAQQYFLTDYKRIEADGTAKHFNLNASGNTLFQHERTLGQGSFGRVPFSFFSLFVARALDLMLTTYRGVDLVRSRLSLKYYARKRVLRGRDTEENRASQIALINELNNMKRLSHIHLVKIMSSYTDDEYISYLMEPVANCTLAEFLAMPEAINPGDKTVLKTFYGCLAGAVNYIHQSKIRHRDLTARNILIKQDQVYVGDFGSAYNSSHRQGSATRHFYTPVSQDYMAPEVAKREERDSKSDMFSLGVIFLEMTTRLLNRSISELRKTLQNHAKKNKSNSSHVHANLPAAVGWLNELSRSNSVEHDNEPLAWVRFLIQEKPTNRPSAVGLMKDILDSPSFPSFCCLKCREEFEERAFQYDIPVHHGEPMVDSLDTRATIENMFRGPGINKDISHGQPGRNHEIARWASMASSEYDQIPQVSAEARVWSNESHVVEVMELPTTYLESERVALREPYADWFTSGGWGVDNPGTGFPPQTIDSGLAVRATIFELPGDSIPASTLPNVGCDAKGLESDSDDTETGYHDTGLGFREYGSVDSEDEPGNQLFEETSDDSDNSDDGVESYSWSKPRPGIRDLEIILEAAEASESEAEVTELQQDPPTQQLFEETSDLSSEEIHDGEEPNQAESLEETFQDVASKANSSRMFPKNRSTELIHAQLTTKKQMHLEQMSTKAPLMTLNPSPTLLVNQM